MYLLIYVGANKNLVMSDFVPIYFGMYRMQRGSEASDNKLIWKTLAAKKNKIDKMRYDKIRY